MKNLSGCLFIMLATVLALACSKEENDPALPISLSDTLFRVTFPPNFYRENESGYQKDLWVYLTDEDGNILGKSYLLRSGEEAVWKRPEGFQGKFNYHQLMVTTANNSTETYFYLRIFTEFPLPFYEPKLQESLQNTGTAPVTLHHDIEQFSHTTIKKRDFSGSFSSSKGDLLTFEIPVYSNSDKLLTYIHPWDNSGIRITPRYSVADVQAGKNLELSYSSFQQVKEVSLRFPENVEHASASATWIVDGTGISIQTNQGGRWATYPMPANNEIEVPYVYTQASNKDGSYSQYLPRQTIGTSISEPSHSTTLNSLGNDLYSLTTQGNPDIVITYWFTPNENGTTYSLDAVQYHNPLSVKNLAKPILPDTLLERIPSLQSALTEVYPEIASSFDYVNLEGYQEYCSDILGNGMSGYNYLTLTGGYTINNKYYSEDSNGRIHHSSSRKTFQHSLENPLQWMEH